MTIHLLYFNVNRGQESSMEKWWFNSMLSNEKLEYRCGLSKSTDSPDPIENTSGSEDRVINNTDKNINNWSQIKSSSYSNVDHLFGVRDIRNFISDDTFLVRDRNGVSYFIYFDIENHIFEIDNDQSFLSELESFFYSYRNSSYLNNVNSSYLNNVSKSNHPHYDRYIGSNNYSDSYIYSYICGQSRTRSEHGSSSKQTSTNGSDLKSSNVLYKINLKSKINICEQCGYHFQMSSSDRIELSIDPGTWDPVDEDMVSLDPIEFHSGEEPYKERIDFYQRKTGLTEAVQTGTGQLNGIPVAIGVMDFQFMGGSMGSVVGEKITRLIEYATNEFLPLILVCSSGGARMQEGSLSLMQMAKISSALYDYQSNKKLFYVSILTSPTTGGVTASFGMLGDIIIAEPNSYIAFAGKRVIEQTLKKTVPEGSQAAEYLFHKGLFDPIVPRNTLKGVLSELFQLHAFFPLNPKKSSRALSSIILFVSNK
ncbi:hypothetical protein AAG906_019287 [Vitis piasezkii]